MTTYQLDVVEETQGAPLWLITFADLTAILVALFVLIFSMSAPFSDKGRGILSGADADTNLSSVPMNSGDRFVQDKDVLANLTIGYVSAVLSERGIYRTEGTVSDRTDNRPISHRIEGDRLVLSLDPDFLFVSGGKSLQPMALDSIATLSDVLSNVANPVSIIAPVLSDDWALAFDRADAMVMALRHSGYSAPVERFVSPGKPDSTLLIVVARNSGGRS